MSQDASANSPITCSMCRKRIDLNNPPWSLICQHLLCDSCKRASVQLFLTCPIDQTPTSVQDLYQNTALIYQLRKSAPQSLLLASYNISQDRVLNSVEENIGVRRVDETGKCIHVRHLGYPCCVHCGTLLEARTEDKEWTCKTCLSLNSTLSYICSFCHKTNDRLREQSLRSHLN